MSMIATSKAPSIEGMRNQQVDEWLRQADTFIRAGRYMAADEVLQRVVRVHPQNELAASYQDRIQFLVKQLSQRVGLNSTTQLEVRRFMDLLSTRKTNQVNSLLVLAKQLMEEGHFQKADETLGKALSIDPVNTYGRGLRQRLDELRYQDSHALSKENEVHYRTFLADLWKNGKPGSEKDGYVSLTQEKLSISHAQHIEILRSVKNDLYKNSLRDIWLTGGLSAFDMETVEGLRSRYEVSWLDHSLIETTLLREVRKNRVRANILIVDSDDANLLCVSQILRSNYFAVIAAGTVAEALEAVKTVTPDVILSEVSFTDGSLGFDLYGFIRSSANTRQTPFLFMTGTLDRTTRLIGKRVGVDDFLMKPVDAELLTATVTGLLMRKPPSPATTQNKESKEFHFFMKRA